MQNVKNRFLSLKPWTRHGGILVVAGIAHIVMGVVYVFHTPTEVRAEALYFALHLMPLDWWGLGFILIGVVTFISSRWPNCPKSWGYTVLTGWSAAWSSFYFAGAVLADNLVVHIGTAGLLALLAFLWWAISGLVSPAKEDVT